VNIGADFVVCATSSFWLPGQRRPKAPRRRKMRHEIPRGTNIRKLGK